MMKNKICLVSGANQGIGFETAKGLAKLGAHTIIVGRDEKKCFETFKNIKNESGNDQIDFLICDLSSIKSIKKMTAEFKLKFPRLDVLINNAGGSFEKRKVTEEGFEYTWALNHLNYFVVTIELLDLLNKSAPSRIVNVSSDWHHQGKINFEDLQSEKSYSALGMYQSTKLCNVLFTKALARRLRETNVTVNAVHPGGVATNIADNSSLLKQAIVFLVKPFLKSPEEGAKTSIFVASNPKLELVSGKYFKNEREGNPHKQSFDENLQERLWEMTLKHVTQALQPN